MGRQGRGEKKTETLNNLCKLFMWIEGTQIESKKKMLLWCRWQQKYILRKKILCPTSKALQASSLPSVALQQGNTTKKASQKILVTSIAAVEGFFSCLENKHNFPGIRGFSSGKGLLSNSKPAAPQGWGRLLSLQSGICNCWSFKSLLVRAPPLSCKSWHHFNYFCKCCPLLAPPCWVVKEKIKSLIWGFIKQLLLLTWYNRCLKYAGLLH